MQRPDLQNGRFLVANAQSPFDIEAALADKGFTWANWIRMTQKPFPSDQIEIVCAFPPDAIGQMAVGVTYVVQAKLMNSVGSRMFFDCQA